jgi:hypothetical protein
MKASLGSLGANCGPDPGQTRGPSQETGPSAQEFGVKASSECGKAPARSQDCGPRPCRWTLSPLPTCPRAATFDHRPEEQRPASDRFEGRKVPAVAFVLHEERRAPLPRHLLRLLRRRHHPGAWADQQRRPGGGAMAAPRWCAPTPPFALCRRPTAADPSRRREQEDPAAARSAHHGARRHRQLGQSHHPFHRRSRHHPCYLRAPASRWTAWCPRAGPDGQWR